MKKRQLHSALLCFTLALFVLRVIGQVLVVFFSVSWLPPLSSWQSGLLPYPLLLALQILLGLLLGAASYANIKQRGYFHLRSAKKLKGLQVFVGLYFLINVLRLMVTIFGNFEVDHWIPIFFHFVLALHLWALSSLAQEARQS